jgi:hypothetical protein
MPQCTGPPKPQGCDRGDTSLITGWPTPTKAVRRAVAYGPGLPRMLRMGPSTLCSLRCLRQVPCAVGLDSDLRPVCGMCVGDSGFGYLCLRCGGEELSAGGECVRCTAQNRLHQHFRDCHGNLDSGAALVVACLSGVRRSRSVLEWLPNPRSGAQILRRILISGDPLTHASLDAFEPGTAVMALRRMVSAHSPAFAAVRCRPCEPARQQRASVAIVTDPVGGIADAALRRA